MTGKLIVGAVAAIVVAALFFCVYALGKKDCELQHTEDLAASATETLNTTSAIIAAPNKGRDELLALMRGNKL